MKLRLILICLVVGFTPSLSASASKLPRYERGYFRQLEQAQKLFQAASSADGLEENFEAAGKLVDNLEFLSLKLSLDLHPEQNKIVGRAEYEVAFKVRASTQLSLNAVDLRIKEVEVDSGSGFAAASFQSKNGLVKIKLEQKPAIGKPYRVRVSYEGSGDTLQGKSSAYDKGIFVTNGDESRSDLSPSVYTSVQPDFARTWFPCVDDPRLKIGKLETSITVPKGWTGISNGALVTTRSEADGRETFVWRFAHRIPTYLVTLNAGRYEILSSRDAKLSTRSVPVMHFAPPNIADKAGEDFKNTPEYMEYFSRTWGDYPFEKYSMITAPLYSGGMEHTTATLVGEALITGQHDSEDTVVHELAHQWWGDIVTLAGWEHLWLNEGFATFSEALAAENLRGREALLDYMIYGQGQVLESDAEGKGAVVDPALSAEDQFSVNAYDKGAWILHMIREQIGADKFNQVLRAYLAKFWMKNATTLDFLEVLNAESGENFTAFFKQWVFGRGYPNLFVEWNKNIGGYHLAIEQKQKAQIFRMDLPVKVFGEKVDGSKASFEQIIALKEANTAMALNVPSDWKGVDAVVVDPNLAYLKKIAVKRSVNEALSLLSSPEWFIRWDVVSSTSISAWPAADLEFFATKLVDAMKSESNNVVLEAALEWLERVKLFPGKVADLVEDALTHESVEVRIAASRLAAEGFLNSSIDSKRLESLFEKELSPTVRGNLALALAKSGRASSYDLVFAELEKQLYSDVNRRFTEKAVLAIGAFRDPRALPFLVGTAKGGTRYLMAAALEALGYFKDPDTFALLTDTLRDKSFESFMRAACVRGLQKWGGVSSVSVLKEALKEEKNSSVKDAIEMALKEMGVDKKPLTTNIQPIGADGTPTLLW